MMMIHLGDVYVFILQFSSHSSLLCTVKMETSIQIQAVSDCEVQNLDSVHFSLCCVQINARLQSISNYASINVLFCHCNHIISYTRGLFCHLFPTNIPSVHNILTSHVTHFNIFALLLLWYTLIIPIMQRDTSHKISLCKYVCPVFPPPSYNLNNTVQSYFMHDFFPPITGL